MTHYAVLRHQFDIHRNPDRLGPLHEEKFCLTMNPGGDAPNWLVGHVVWLVSWEGFMKTHHIVPGWFKVDHFGRRHGVVTHHYAAGTDGELFPRPVGPLDMHPWFHSFVEAHRGFREGHPTDLGSHLGELIALARSAGYRVPEVVAADSSAPSST
jgi:hypothetical protein